MELPFYESISRFGGIALKWLQRFLRGRGGKNSDFEILYQARDSDGCGKAFTDSSRRFCLARVQLKIP